MSSLPQQRSQSGSSQEDSSSMNGNNRRLPKKKTRGGRAKKKHEEADEDVEVKENGEWDADYHLFGIKSPKSKTIRASDLTETTNL